MGSWCSRGRLSSRPLAAAARAAVPGGGGGGADVLRLGVRERAAELGVVSSSSARCARMQAAMYLRGSSNV
eukprot:1058646-Alexandrium_andersonii.AAC.1